MGGGVAGARAGGCAAQAGRMSRTGSSRRRMPASKDGSTPRPDFRHRFRNRRARRLRRIPLLRRSAAMSQWYLHDPASNQRQGPMDLDAARAAAARDPTLLAWKEGMGDWLPARNIAELVGGVPGDP